MIYFGGRISNQLCKAFLNIQTSQFSSSRLLVNGEQFFTKLTYIYIVTFVRLHCVFSKANHSPVPTCKCSDRKETILLYPGSRTVFRDENNTGGHVTSHCCIFSVDPELCLSEARAPVRRTSRIFFLLLSCRQRLLSCLKRKQKISFEKSIPVLLCSCSYKLGLLAQRKHTGKIARQTVSRKKIIKLGREK